MKLNELKARADRIQQLRGFKLIASAVIVLIAVIVSVSSLVASASPVLQQAAQPNAEVGPESSITNTDAAQLMLETVLQGARGPTGTVIASGIVAGAALVVVWLGLGLTYMMLGVVLAVFAGPLWLFEETRGLSKLIVGVVVLAASFSALMQGLRLILGGKGPIRAIARNVLAEAVRLRLSIIFIVLLIFGLAALPGMLNAEQPLRYRVQSFMQFGTGGSFWLIAMLTVFFSVSTVATEQRDKIIWQTMTKPVAAWQYIFGKWLGISGLAAVLLAVSSSGVFLFVEYLRNQPAIGEKEAYIAYADSGLSEDRLVLETQILSAQRTIPAEEPPMDQDKIETIIEQTIKALRDEDPDYVVTQEIRDQMLEELYERGRLMYFSIPPGGTQTYVFKDIKLGATEDVPMVIKYRVDASANEPDLQFKISIGLLGMAPVVRDTGLGHTHTLPIAPIIVIPPVPSDPAPRVILPDEASFTRALQAIERGELPGARYVTAGEMIADGDLVIEISNGEFAYTVEGRQIVGTGTIPNSAGMRIPTGGLSLSYNAGSYHANYARTMGVLWLKLAFLAMLGIFCSTFLSFPVASMVTFGVFLMAESSGYLRLAIDNYATLNAQGQLNFVKLIISAITFSVSWIFKTYAELSPVERLVNGQVVGGVTVLKGVGIIGLWCALLFAASVHIFRKRDLAIYSGQ
ncbi:MAG: ABC transporter permease [Phycisphaerales bacterium JB061]